MSSATIKNIILWGALLLVVVVLVVGTHNALTVRVPGMNDFIIRYEGARSFWLEGVSPYSEQATLNIQMAMYGKPYPPPHEFVALFFYPFYTLLYVSPFLLLPTYAWASAAWMVFLEICLIGATFLWLDVLRWKPSRWMMVALLSFSLLNYYAFRGLILGQPSHLAHFCTALTVWGLVKRQDRLAGFALAISTFKPQMGFLIVPFLLLWGMRQQRWNFIAGFGVTFGVLMGVSFALEPNWFPLWIEQVLAYPNNSRDGSPIWIVFEFFLNWTPWIGYGIRAVLVGWMLWYWVQTLILIRKEGVMYTALLTVLVTHTAGPRTATPHYVVFIPILLLALQTFTHKKWHWANVSLLLVFLVAPWAHFLTTILDPNLENLAVFLPLIGILWIVLPLMRQQWISREWFT